MLKTTEKYQKTGELNLDLRTIKGIIQRKFYKNYTSGVELTYPNIK